MGLILCRLRASPHNLCLTTPRASTFPRRDRARLQRTTLLMGGSIVARNAGRNTAGSRKAGVVGADVRRHIFPKMRDQSQIRARSEPDQSLLTSAPTILGSAAGRSDR